MNWTLGPFEKQHVDNPVLGCQPGSIWHCPVRGKIAWESKDVFNPAAIVCDGQVHLFYRAEDHVGKFLGTSRIGHATSKDGVHFERANSPVLYPGHDQMSALESEGGCEDPRIIRTPRVNS